jgi:hypothetical protein
MEVTRIGNGFSATKSPNRNPPTEENITLEKSKVA